MIGSNSGDADRLQFDVAVVGAGAAGLWAALAAAEVGARVGLVSRSPLAETASFWAQGGLAAALAEDDSPDLHGEDTIAAGRGTCRPSAVSVLCGDAPAEVGALEAAGIGFDLDEHGKLALGLEGGHSRRRIVHSGGSSTGRRITRELSALVANHRQIRVLESITARGLLSSGDRCVGAVADELEIRARSTIFATGGAAALWQRTTNPAGAIGSGIAVAHAAGAAVADLELVQFHPTALRLGQDADPRHDGFLITEAVRGEGATLVDASGKRFVDELAPRDEVARAVLEQGRQDGRQYVCLDMRAIDTDRFPNVVAALRKVGIEPTTDLVPVSPAAHYMMGGIVTDLEARSTLAGLYAVGECSCTGLHGANRLASNSLTECFVFGRRAGVAAAEDAVSGPIPTGTEVRPVTLGSSPVPDAETRSALWRRAGLERSESGLKELLDLPHTLARLVGESALARRESRGVHWRRDFPETDPELDRSHIVTRSHDLSFESWR